MRQPIDFGCDVGTNEGETHNAISEATLWGRHEEDAGWVIDRIEVAGPAVPSTDFWFRIS